MSVKSEEYRSWSSRRGWGVFQVEAKRGSQPGVQQNFFVACEGSRERPSSRREAAGLDDIGLRDSLVEVWERANGQE
jgi:hypothetical protein